MGFRINNIYEELIDEILLTEEERQTGYPKLSRHNENK